MESNWAMFRPKNTIVLKLGNKVVVARRIKMDVKPLTPRIAGYHALVHSILYPDKNVRSFVDHYVDVPSDILRLAGRMKNNLALLLNFIGQIELPPLTELEPDQLVLYNLLCFNQKEWHDLLRYDIETFIRLEGFLNIDASQKAGLSQQIRALLCVLKPSNEEAGSKAACAGNCTVSGAEECDQGAHASANFILKLHEEFCENNGIVSDLDTKMKMYSNMIRCIRDNRTPTVLCEELPFYHEIGLINDFILSCSDPNYLNPDLLRMDCKTPNEILIKQFVTGKIQKEN